MNHLSALAGALVRRPTLSMATLLRAMALGYSRRRLLKLDDRLLRDVGLTRTEARREADKPVWNAPDHWLR